MNKRLEKINNKIIIDEKIPILVEKLEKVLNKPINEIMVDLIIQESKKYGFIEARD